METKKEQIKEEIGYITIPVVTYMLEKEMVERREKRLHKIIIGLIVALFMTAILITGGFLLYMNQYEFTDTTTTISQTTESGENGISTISDGISYNE